MACFIEPDAPHSGAAALVEMIWLCTPVWMIVLCMHSKYRFICWCNLLKSHINCNYMYNVQCVVDIVFLSPFLSLSAPQLCLSSSLRYLPLCHTLPPNPSQVLFFNLSSSHGRLTVLHSIAALSPSPVIHSISPSSSYLTSADLAFIAAVLVKP